MAIFQRTRFGEHGWLDDDVLFERVGIDRIVRGERCENPLDFAVFGIDVKLAFGKGNLEILRRERVVAPDFQVVREKLFRELDFVRRADRPVVFWREREIAVVVPMPDALDRGTDRNTLGNVIPGVSAIRGGAVKREGYGRDGRFLVDVREWPSDRAFHFEESGLTCVPEGKADECDKKAENRNPCDLANFFVRLERSGDFFRNLSGQRAECGDVCGRSVGSENR